MYLLDISYLTIALTGTKIHACRNASHRIRDKAGRKLAEEASLTGILPIKD